MTAAHLEPVNNRKASTVYDLTSPLPRAPRPPRARLATTFVAGALAVSLLGACSSSKKTATSDTTVAGATGTTLAGASGVTHKFKALDPGGPLTVSAIKKGSVDVGELFTFSPEISKNKWLILTDDKHLQAADNFVPAMNAKKVTPEITAVLNAVDAKLTQDGVAGLVDQVANGGQNPDDVAKAWLKSETLPGSLKATGSLTVGTQNFAESAVVGNIYAAALKDAGVSVTLKSDFGTRQATTPALESGKLDLLPEFTTSFLLFLDPNAKTSSNLDATYAALETAASAKGITVLKPTQVSDVNVFVVTPETSTKYNLKSLSDLAKVDVPLTLGGAPECPKNAQCLIGLEKVYGLKFAVQ